MQNMDILISRSSLYVCESACRHYMYVSVRVFSLKAREGMWVDDTYPHIISYFWEKHAHVCGFVVCCFSCLSSCCGFSCYHYNLRVWRLCWRPFLMRATVYSDSCVFILFVRINTYCLVCLSGCPYF